ncbi:MAG TPA: ribbon-helix-helix protein, CopG family [Gammaproteobacteria bacterium]|nr:ribbon-helix-helix protein, CopG family [Gammaproteobacteria bacterium]
MRENISISLPEDLKAELDRVSSLEGVSRSDLLREALKEYLFVKEFRALRTRMVAQAQVNGIFTDEDVFNRTS